MFLLHVEHCLFASLSVTQLSTLPAATVRFLLEAEQGYYIELTDGIDSVVQELNRDEQHGEPGRQVEDCARP
jgi:hypothetical protein